MSSRNERDVEVAARLRGKFLAESQRLLPEVVWRQDEHGALVHPDEALRLFVSFEDREITVGIGPEGMHWHFGAWDPAPEIEPDEETESAKNALVWIRELLQKAR